MQPDDLQTLAGSLGEPQSRRGVALGLLAGSLAAVLGQDEAAEARKRKRKRRNKRKNANKKNDNQSAKDVGAPHVSLGVYIPRALDDPAVLSNFASTIGRAVDFTVWYEGWSNGNFGRNQRVYLETMDAGNLAPVISWNPFDPNGHTINQPAYRLSTIYGGNHNAYIDSWATGLATYGKPVYLKFAHEMNGNWFPWGIGVNGNQLGDFKLAWRHVHDRFKAKGADNVRWVFVPNQIYNGVPASIRDVYPGDNYVDWLGMNGYNWGTAVTWASCNCSSTWYTFPEIFDSTYRELTSLGNKPIMVGETASAEPGGKKEDWIIDTMLKVIPSRYPQIRAFTWFNKIATGLDTVSPGNVEPTTEVDWRIESSQAAQKAFRKAAMNSYYAATLKSIG